MTINQKPSKAMVTYPWFVSDRDTKTNKGVVYSLCSTTSAKAVEGAKIIIQHNPSYSFRTVHIFNIETKRFERVEVSFCYTESRVCHYSLIIMTQITQTIEIHIGFHLYRRTTSQNFFG